jgi:TDG/mug DNA glycosylase family protein
MLADLVCPGLRLVICGRAVGDRSAATGTYYAAPSNRFWRVLAAVGLTPRLLRPEEFHLLPRFGIGLTDLVQGQSGPDHRIHDTPADAQRLRARIARARPAVLAFNGKKSAAGFLDRDTTKISYGLQGERLGETRLFVAPSTSGRASAHWDPRPWRELAALTASASRDPTDAITRLTHTLSHLAITAPPPEALHHDHLDEAWLRDRLAWLLDPRESHGLGPAFLRRFLERLAPSSAAADLDASAATVLRELHLSGQVPAPARAPAPHKRHLDLAILDPTPGRGRLVAVETKLFTTDHDQQLAAYHRALADRFGDLPVADHVYLSLFGHPPHFDDRTARPCRRAWRALSWVDHILPALEATATDHRLPVPATELRDLLRWFAGLRANWPRLGPLAATVIPTAIRAVVEILLAELRRRNTGTSGTWRVKHRGHTRTTLTFSRTPARRVVVRVLPSLTVMVLAAHGQRGVTDRRVIPAGSGTEPFLALLERAAADVYPMLLGTSAERYAPPTSPRPDDPSARRQWGPLLATLLQHRHELPLLAAVQRLLGG